jgi:polyhydroxyalkanoate synthesis regulator phasin
MEYNEMFKQMITFNKTAFDNSYNAMVTLQEQTEKMANNFLDQASWLPEEGKKVTLDWIKAYKKACEDFKKTVDENFKRVEDFFSGAK